MREDFLRYIWQYHIRTQVKYRTTEGLFFVVLDKGVVNTDAGPDILFARIKINDIEWSGSVEFHVKASEWEQHGHGRDTAYNNVLLHFVAEADKVAYTQDGRLIPTAIFPKLHRYYNIFEDTFAAKRFIYCENNIGTITNFVKTMWLQRLVIERLEQKTENIFHMLKRNNEDWEETAYQTLVRYLGQKLNGDAFEHLARQLPQRILAKHKSSLLQLEALFFGQAGMLQADNKDSYYTKLQKEYDFLRKKYDLLPIQEAEWKFLRLRPANFPSLRIAQLAVLVKHSDWIFSKIIDIETLKEYRNMFSHGVSDYWKTHYLFGKQTASRIQRKIGIQLQDTLIINAVVPILFAYAKYIGESLYQQKALRLLQEINAEHNHITRGFSQLGFELNTSYDSQAVLQLKQKYCNFRHCERCVIGHEILKQHYG